MSKPELASDSAFAKTRPTFRHYPSPAAAADDMAREAVAFLRKRIQTAGTASMVLTGGSSPGKFYNAIASQHADSINWRAVHFFWGDERRVEHQHSDSNMQATSALLDALDVDAAKLHTWDTLSAPEEALASMRRVLAKAEYGTDQLFDLVLLGVGPDGHVASLFPNDEPWLDLAEEAVDDVHYIADSPKPPAERFTFTLPRLNAARHLWMTPFGASKQDAVKAIRDGRTDMTAPYLHGQEATVVWTDVKV